jgi:hypothetical protein
MHEKIDEHHSRCYCKFNPDRLTNEELITVYDKMITLPWPEELEQLLVRVDSGDHAAEFLHPIIVKRAARGFMAPPGVILMLDTAFTDYMREKKVPAEGFIKEFWMKPYLRAIIQDPDFLDEALRLLNDQGESAQ